MKIEHIAFNVPDPVAMGRWYVEHLGLTVRRRTVDQPYAHFLADDSGTVMLEIYGNRDARMPDYQRQDPAIFHIAFVSPDIVADVERLVKAGATLLGEIEDGSKGDKLAMLRDPWGVPIQLVTRGTPMIDE